MESRVLRALVALSQTRMRGVVRRVALPPSATPDARGWATFWARSLHRPPNLSGGALNHARLVLSNLPAIYPTRQSFHLHRRIKCSRHFPPHIDCGHRVVLHVVGCRQVARVPGGVQPGK